MSTRVLFWMVGALLTIATSWLWKRLTANLKTRRQLETELALLRQDSLMEASRVHQLERRIDSLEAARGGPYR